MLESPQEILDNNRKWAQETHAKDPQFFERLGDGQSPGYVWIGCADSRVPASVITGLPPGELFVHRNVANQVIHSDLNCLSVLQFGIDVLGAKHVIVCGHYGCGGVAACSHEQSNGLVDNWILHINDIRDKFEDQLAPLADEDRLNRLCELNVLQQAKNLCNTTVVRDAWARGQELSVHAWIYEINDGNIADLGMDVDNAKDIKPAYEKTLARLLA